MAAKKSGLGRGLDALFADTASIVDNETNDKEDYEDRVLYIDINDIRANATQPRLHFDEKKLDELASSIKDNGVIQPLVLRNTQKGYEIVAGERRWRASRKAGLKKVPCIVRDFDDKQNMLVAIIENMQREDLNPIEEALGLKKMLKKYNLTQEQVSDSVGKSRPYIANSLRLLKLPDKIQNHIASNEISAAHGRSIAGLTDEDLQLELCDRIIKKGLSVRETEKILANKKNITNVKKDKVKSSEILSVEDELKVKLGTKVLINDNGKSGKIELQYYSIEELNRLIDLLRSIRD
ncbi:MAG: ParB/RepB/Spo0J family partition protein [Peptostreptococcaceae bacterium]|nr:ParB/RepB/Spo0J family partition protein [Peptostreptococcaceae bacterium]